MTYLNYIVRTVLPLPEDTCEKIKTLSSNKRLTILHSSPYLRVSKLNKPHRHLLEEIQQLKV